MHTIFENQYYLPQQMWVYLYNILLTVVANSFVLHSKQSKIKTILLQSVLFYLLLIPQHFDNIPSWTTQLSLLTIVIGNILLYKDKFHIKVITSIVSILIIFFSDYLSYFIVSVLFGSSENYLQEPCLPCVCHSNNHSARCIHYNRQQISKKKTEICSLEATLFFCLC